MFSREEKAYLLRMSLMSSQEADMDLNERPVEDIYERIVNKFLDLNRRDELRKWFIDASWNEIAMVLIQATHDG